MSSDPRARTNIRLADIAVQAGVSEATVSRVLNDKPGVSPDTRQAVLTALDVLGYERPDRLRKWRRAGRRSGTGRHLRSRRRGAPLTRTGRVGHKLTARARPAKCRDLPAARLSACR